MRLTALFVLLPGLAWGQTLAPIVATPVPLVTLARQLAPSIPGLMSGSLAGSTVMPVRLNMGTSAYPIDQEGAVWSNGPRVDVGFTADFGAGQGNGYGPVMTMLIMANNTGTTSAAVPLITDCVVRVANGTCFGGNDITRNGAGINGAVMVGREIDLEYAPGTTAGAGSIGLAMNAFSINTGATAVQMGGGPGGTGTWGNGFGCAYVRNGSCFFATAGLTQATTFIDTRAAPSFAGGAAALGNGIGQRLGFDGTAANRQAQVYVDGGDNLTMVMGTAGLTITNQARTQFSVFDPFGTLTVPGVTVSAAAGLRVTPSTPATSAAVCTIGMISVDASYAYVCTGTNAWKRAALTTW